MLNQSWGWPLLPIGGGQDLVEDRIKWARQVHFLQESCEATLTRLPPAVHFGDDASQREGRQVQTQRFQDADDNGLATSAVQSFAGPPGLARRCGATQRALGFVVRAGYRRALPIGRRRGLRRHKREQLL